MMQRDANLSNSYRSDWCCFSKPAQSYCKAFAKFSTNTRAYIVQLHILYNYEYIYSKSKRSYVVQVLVHIWHKYLYINSTNTCTYI